MNYYLEVFDKNENSEERWSFLVEYALTEADSVAFNVLYRDEVLEGIEIEIFDGGLKPFKGDTKIYKSGEAVSSLINIPILNFIKGRKYSEWQNFCLEDISFIKNGVEFIATITHEDYVIALLDDDLKKKFVDMGLEFGTSISLESE